MHRRQWTQQWPSTTCRWWWISLTSSTRKRKWPQGVGWAEREGRALRALVPGPLPSSLWKLDLCTTVLPQIEKLLQSKYERCVWGSPACLVAGRGGGRGLLQGPWERPPRPVPMRGGRAALPSPPSPRDARAGTSRAASTALSVSAPLCAPCCLSFCLWLHLSVCL